ncbi:caspase-8-like [Limanda limanda]|uniref:caspase-8-like n=1 Tax=Limanda limanda TaxID=27771 RepID=UPI0029C663A9|nr:caspase-8-like [Limanda limanda]
MQRIIISTGMTLEQKHTRSRTLQDPSQTLLVLKREKRKLADENVRLRKLEAEYYAQKEMEDENPYNFKISSDSDESDTSSPLSPEELRVLLRKQGLQVFSPDDEELPEEKRKKSSISLLHEFNVKEWICSGFTELKTSLKHGDAFICCILSHGLKGEVFGKDWKSLTIKQITKTFKSSDQSALTGKPKVFLIQACQGPHRHRGVLLADLEADDSSLQCIPEEADVLVAFATVEDHVSYRSTTEGSWFIQSVCQKLKEGCCRNDDFITILKRVNKDVSQKEGTGQSGAAKQMPEVRFTLRKSLLLSPLGASSLLS